jgi:RND superfamily putative drug exporter
MREEARLPDGAPTIKRSFLFDRWPRFASRHPWLPLAGAAVILTALAAAYIAGHGEYGDAFNLPGAEAQQLTDMLQERFPGRAGEAATIVVSAPAGLDDPQVQSRVQSLLAELAALPDVVGVSSPYETPGAISPDRTIARISVQYSKTAFHLDKPSASALMDLRQQSSTPDFQVEAGGAIVWRAERRPPESTEAIGLATAVIILLVAFGSVVAMGLPIITALLALASGFFLLGVGTSLVTMPSFTSEFTAMVGIGVGIDYALLIVTRFREALANKLSVEEAIVQASATAGRSVVFAGSTVVIALLGLFAVGIPFVGYVGAAAALFVALSVLVAVFVLPAILRIAARHIDRWRLPGLAAPVHDSETGLGYRLSRMVQRAPVLFLAGSLVILLGLAAPVLAMRLGTSDAGNNPPSYTSRRSYDLLSRGFGPGFNAPIIVGFAVNDAAAATKVEQLPAALKGVDGVAGVSPPTFNQDRSAAVITVFPSTEPQAQETADLVHRLRTMVHQSFNGSSGQALVGGTTALVIDVGDKISAGLPLFFGAVIGLSFLLLMAVFRSVVVALKAAAMNLLSIGAAFGVMVAIFQWGWLGNIVGVHREGPIEAFLPMMLFAVLFGLSMDYEVFLVGRIREEYLRTGDNTESVARGLSLTTRVISAAAAIMIAVFLSFALSDQRVVKEFGIGLATAIFVDATIVRLILVPSVMQLMGSANWWFPAWLDRIVPRVGVDRNRPARPAAARQPAPVIPD